MFNLLIVLVAFSLLIWANFVSKEYLKFFTFTCSIVSLIEGFLGVLYGIDSYNVLNKTKNYAL